MDTLVSKIINGTDLTFHLEFQLDEESGWTTVHVAELPGCVSQGATVQDAKMNIADALESYMEVLLDDAIRRQLPESSPAFPCTTPLLDQTAVLLVRPRFEVTA